MNEDAQPSSSGLLLGFLLIATLIALIVLMAWGCGWLAYCAWHMAFGWFA